jgi:nucleotide-binding universal stress UspA family protein
MFERILVATDGSTHGRNATRVAGSLAGRYDAELIIAHVVTDKPVPEELRRMAEVEHLVKMPEPEPSSTLGRLSLKPSQEIVDQQLKGAIANKLLEQGAALAKQAGATKVKPLEMEGEAAEALVRATKERGVDLVVIGSRSFGPLGRLLHGSVSTEVSQHVRCPCLIVKRPDNS